MTDSLDGGVMTRTLRQAIGEWRCAFSHIAFFVQLAWEAQRNRCDPPRRYSGFARKSDRS